MNSHMPPRGHFAIRDIPEEHVRGKEKGPSRCKSHFRFWPVPDVSQCMYVIQVKGSQTFCHSTMKLSSLLSLLFLVPAVLAARNGMRNGMKRAGKRGGKRMKKRGGRAKRRQVPKIFSGSIDVVKPNFERVNDAFDNLLGLKLIAPGTSDIFGDFTATFFFTPFQGQEPFDGTCTFEDAAGNVLNAAFFGASILYSKDGETELRVPLEAHIIGGNGLYEGCSGKLELSGTIKPSAENGFGPTHFMMRGSIMKMPKKVKNKQLKLLGIPKSIPFDGIAMFPEMSKALDKKSLSDMAENVIEPESETEAYAGSNVPIEESPEKQEEANISKLEGTAKVKKLGNMNVSVLMESFEVGTPFDGTLMMKLLDKGSGEESGHAIKAQFARAIMSPKMNGDLNFLIPATIIGGYGDYGQAKGAVIFSGKVERDDEGNLGMAYLEIEGDIITEAIVDEWEKKGHEESIRGGSGRA
jgi:hypothetical protein